MKEKLIKAVIAILTASIIIGGGYYFYRKYASSTQANTTVRYTQATVKKGRIEVSIQATGTVFGAVTKDAISNNSGEIRDLAVKPGDMVTQGAKLCTVNNEQLKQSIYQAQMDVDSLKLQLSKYKTPEDIELQNLKIADAERKLASAKEQVSKMTVYVPINGLVVSKTNDNGDNIQSGKSIISIVDTSVMKIKIPVDELDISKVKIGQTASIKFGAIKDKSYEGTVENIAQLGTTSNNVTTYDVVVAIKNPEGLKLGMNGAVTIGVEAKDDVLTIPVEALIERNGRKYVLLREENVSAGEKSSSAATTKAKNKANKKIEVADQTEGMGTLVEVKIGLENENFIEITEGLKEGDIIVIILPQSTTTTGKQTGGQGRSLFPNTTVKPKNNK